MAHFCFDALVTAAPNWGSLLREAGLSSMQPWPPLWLGRMGSMLSLADFDGPARTRLSQVDVKRGLQSESNATKQKEDRVMICEAFGGRL